MPLRRHERLAEERRCILRALYAMDGEFTRPYLVVMAGGQHLHHHAGRILRESVADGTVIVVDGKQRPHVYRLAEDEK